MIMINKCIKCNNELLFDLNQTLEFCDVCSNITYLNNISIVMKEEEKKLVKLLINSYEDKNETLYNLIVNDLKILNLENIFIYIVKALKYLDKRSNDFEDFLYYKDDDDLIDCIINYLFKNKDENITVNHITAEFSIGYNRAQHILKIIEHVGILKTDDKNHLRKVNITKDEYEKINKALVNNNIRGINKLITYAPLIKDNKNIKMIKYLENKLNIKII